MKRSRSLSFAVAAAIGLAAGIGGGLPSNTLADDTEIYLGASVVKEGIRPNVLFILDTSGSMAATVKGTGMDRLDNMKVAIKKILDGVNNVNVGLMRFTDPGGPILFPVSYIDEDVSVVEGTSDVTDLDVNVQVDQSSDDAEEVKSVTWSGDDLEDFEDELAATTGVMNLTSPVLDIVELEKSISAGGNDFETRVQASNDDVEQYTDDGTMVMNGSRLGMGFDDGHQQAVGLRFQDVEVPAGATILSAELAFTNQENETTQGFTLRITGEASDNPSGFTTSAWNVTNRPRTAAYVDWVDPEPWTVGGKDAYPTPDITKIVQEIVSRPGWANGNAMAFIVENAPGSTGDYNRRRNGRSYDNSSTQAPILRITWTTEANPGGVQKIGLRFRNVPIPQGAVIKKAYIEFRPDSDAPTGTSYFDIHGHDIDDAPTFTGFDNDISKRNKTYKKVDWHIDDADWQVGVPHQTPDLKDVVQEIVDRSGWCGNNAMAFIIEPSTTYAAYNHLIGPRIANAFDSDPTNAPILRVEYDEASVSSSACIDQWVQRQVESSDDDAEQVVTKGTIQLRSTDLDFDKKAMSGMRFQDIPIAQGQKILEARLVFTADATETGVVDLIFRGQVSADAAAFQNSENNLSSRVKTTASAAWSPPDQTAGQTYVSPDLSAIVQEIVNHSSWAPGNALAIIEEFVSGSGTARRVKTFDSDPAKAPILRIKVEGQLATSGAGQNSVRTVMKEIVDDLDHIGHTPIVDTLFEAARYFRGDKVLYGYSRGVDRDSEYYGPGHPDYGTILQPKPNADSTNDKTRRNTRVSHPASWTNGNIVRNNDCTENNLNHDDCKEEFIDGDPIYTSPISSNCQSNYVILLTDGIANHNHSEQAIRDYLGISSCEGGNGNQACGLELVKWLYEEDQISTLDGKQSVSTYTIGFNFSSQWLEDVAVAGGGRFHTANTADELVREVTQIFSDIMNRSTSFAAPTLSVNAFNKLFHRSDVYFSLFKPSSSVRWDGNLKKYQLCQSASAGCDLGEVLDANAVPAIEKDPASEDLGRIRDSALSFWSDGVDGSEIKVGGAGLEIPPPDSRKVLTYTGDLAPKNAALDTTAHRVATTASEKGVLSGLSGSLSERRQRTQELVGDFAYATTDDERQELFDWMLGHDIHGLEDVPSLEADGRRFAFNDPLHSSAVAVTFGGTDTDPVIKLFVGTNDGGLRAVNAATGAEEWIFYPQATLLNQETIMDNFAGKHVYGLDGNPSVWLNDRNSNGVIEPGSDANGDGRIDETEGDFVRIFIGMRRGGRNIYAFDVTPSTALTDNTVGKIPPTYMWRIDGGVGDFGNLGQTWSTPKITQMVFGTDTADEAVTRTVLVFAGGYDDGQDGGFGPGGFGNGIYVVDPYDGSLLFVVSGTDNGLTNQVIVPDMDYPIPSDLALMDSNGDGATDRILVGDTGGQMWRVDIAPDRAASSPTIKPVVGKLATVSNNVDPLDRRKFFYPPDVVRVHDGAYSGTGEYDLVVAVTGNRAHPLDEEVQNRLFAFRDYVTSRLPDADDNGLADFYAPLQGALADPPTVGDLLDVTDVLDFGDSTNVANLEAADGWYINLEGNGEKGLAAPVILGGQLFFTTYVPEGVINTTTCSIAEGVGRLYGLNVLNGAPTQNWDGLGDDTNLTKADRIYSLGSGIPSQAVPIFQPEGVTLLIGGGGGATSVNPNIGLPRERTYWYQSMR